MSLLIPTPFLQIGNRTNSDDTTGSPPYRVLPECGSSLQYQDVISSDRAIQRLKAVSKPQLQSGDRICLLLVSGLLVWAKWFLARNHLRIAACVVWKREGADRKDVQRRKGLEVKSMKHRLITLKQTKTDRCWFESFVCVVCLCCKAWYLAPSVQLLRL